MKHFLFCILSGTCVGSGLGSVSNGELGGWWVLSIGIAGVITSFPFIWEHLKD